MGSCDARIGSELFRHNDIELIGVEAAAIVTGVAPPGGLPDDVALLAHGGFRQFHYAGTINKLKKMRSRLKTHL